MSDTKAKCSEQDVIELLDSDTDDDKAATSNKRKRTVTVSKPAPAITSVYIAFSCNYPCQNDKWGEDSGHETEDTQVLGVYANLKDANRHAKSETYMDEKSDDDDDDDDDDDGSLFYWQEEEPAEWTARRVWVEEKQIQY